MWSGSRQLAYHIVIDDGTRILTKWSEIARDRGVLGVDATGNDRRDVKLLGVYEEEDFIVLEIIGIAPNPRQIFLLTGSLVES
ncbi:MAG: hypothetical protein WED15_02285 [Akkermansiaceae bacterium]